MPNSVSIIIPAKNEEANIARTLESINRCKESSLIEEIILVDCYSTDKTIAIANFYPIKILQLEPEWIHSPAAARYIGSLFAQGELIFFIDADMTLHPEFLQKAVAIMNSDKDIAGLSGQGEEKYLKNNNLVGNKNNLYKTSKLMREVKFLGGSALYRKKILIDSGGFNPYLYAGEEIELAQRLRKNYKLISIPIPMITHFTAPIQEWEEFIHKKENRLFIGIGQSMRASSSFYFFIEKLFYYKEYLFFIGLIITTVLSATLAVLTGKPQYLSFFPLTTLTLLCFLSLKNKGLVNGLLSLIKWLIISKEITCGLFIKPKNYKDYPQNPNIIKGNFNA
jgi:glycosyltransferase involved in cell wall biosynthesis